MYSGGLFYLVLTEESIMPIPPCGFITYRMSQTLHKEVNASLREYANSTFDELDAEHLRLMEACPYTRYEPREKWKTLASAMYYAGVKLIERGYVVPQ
jgi:hypothetical protein